MRGIHEPYDLPVVPPRLPGEEITAWMERIARANEWTSPDPKEAPEPGADG